MQMDDFEEDMKDIFGNSLEGTFGGRSPNGTGIYISGNTGMIEYWRDLYDRGYFVQCIDHTSKNTQIWIWSIKDADEVANFPEEIFAYHQESEPDKVVMGEDMTPEPQKQPDPDVSGPDTITYECKDCGKRFQIDNVVEYNGCPDCYSTSTVRI